MVQFSKTEAVKFGWEAFKKFPWVLIGITLTVAVIPQAIQYLFQIPFQGMAQGTNEESFTPVMFIGTLISVVVSLFLSVGLLKIYLKLADTKKIEYKELFTVNAEEVVRYFLGSLIYGLIVFAGFILLIIPGIYWGIKYQYYSYLIVEKKMGPLDAIKKSGQITQGNIGNLFLFNLLLIVVSLLGLLALVVGVLVASPVVGIAQAYVYRKLSAAKK
jgi:uncharacterized membrane protein